MVNFKNLSFLVLYTFLCTILIFLTRSIFFGDVSEEVYIEPSGENTSENFDLSSGYYSFSGTTQTEVNAHISQLIREKYEDEVLQSTQNLPAQEIQIHYIPGNIEKRIEKSHIPLLESFLFFPDIAPSIGTLGVYMYQEIDEVRGKMKSENIHMFGVLERGEEEFLSVFIHEFGHYFDIYTLKKSTFGDESQKFYTISWESQNIMKRQLLQTDFVSGYAMTNQYEDFAETYVYYILHNRDFFTRSQSSTILREKYDFFEKYVFSKKQFYKEDFSQDQELKSYYWDITKISIDVKKFLQYLQKEI